MAERGGVGGIFVSCTICAVAATACLACVLVKGRYLGQVSRVLTRNTREIF